MGRHARDRHARRAARNRTECTNRPCRPLVNATAVTAPALHAERGLSRLEFAACVAVIAVLSAVFMNSLGPWQSRAREVQLQAALASLHAADTRFQAVCSRASPNGCARLSLDGQVVAGANDRPAASSDGIARLAGLTAPDWVALPEQHGGVPALRIRPASAAPGRCELLYVQAPKQGAAPVIQALVPSCD